MNLEVWNIGVLGFCSIPSLAYVILPSIFSSADLQYFIFCQLAAFVIMAPYIDAGKRYEDVFQNQHKYVSPIWYALFNSVSAFSNTGTSLSDASLVPFQTAYLQNFSKCLIHRRVFVAD